MKHNLAMMRSILLLTACLIFTACVKQTGFDFEKITIITRDAGKLAAWYNKMLDFEISEDSTLLSSKKVFIKLEEKTHARQRSIIAKELGVQHLPGFFKVGFLTNQFESLAEHLRNQGADLHGSIVTDKVTGTRTFAVKDPDGNQLQFFESNGNSKLDPYFLSLIVENIGEQEKWYQLKFQVEEEHDLDAPKGTSIRVLAGKDLLFELIQLTDKSVKSEIDYQHTTGFYSMEVQGARGNFKADHENNKIVSP